jgi:L-ascorbate metabolism protein UlaG (beta-lactamase superfamily)
LWIKNTIIEAGWFQNYPKAHAVQITYLPAKHWNRRGLSDLNEMLWGSFMLTHQNQSLYFGADSGMGQHFEIITDLFPNIDYALLGIGAYQPEWFMATAHTSPIEAYEAFQILKAQHMIPMHYGTFDLSDEPIFYPKTELLKLKTEQNIHSILFPNIGETLSLF